MRQGSKLTRDMMVMKAMTASCCRVRSAEPEIQFPTEQRGSILYSFLLYPQHKIFSHLQNKKERSNFFLYIKIDFWHGRSRTVTAFIPDNISAHVHLLELKNKDGCCQLGFSVWLIFHKNSKSVSAKIMTGLSLSILLAEKSQSIQLPTFSSLGAHIKSDNNIFFCSSCNDNSLHAMAH